MRRPHRLPSPTSESNALTFTSADLTALNTLPSLRRNTGGVCLIGLTLSSLRRSAKVWILGETSEVYVCVCVVVVKVLGWQETWMDRCRGVEAKWRRPISLLLLFFVRDFPPPLLLLPSFLIIFFSFELTKLESPSKTSLLHVGHLRRTRVHLNYIVGGVRVCVCDLSSPVCRGAHCSPRVKWETTTRRLWRRRWRTAGR